jgi:glutathione S-transferase
MPWPRRRHADEEEEPTVKILNDATSPFGRKTIVAAIERSIPVEEVFVDLNGPTLDPWNPLRQIPTLVPDSGPAVFDSDVIVQYLDGLHSGPPLIPKKDPHFVLTRMSLANGLMEATLTRLIETRRPAQERSDPFVAKMEARIQRTLDALSANLTDYSSSSDVLCADQITIVVALGYVDFRFNRDWHGKYSALASWYDGVAARRSMALTAPTRTSPVSKSEISKR